MKHFLFFLPLVANFNSLAQTQKKVSAYIDFHVDKTIYDRTVSNNAVGFGAGLQVFLNTNSRFKPNIEATSDAFGGTKELRLTPDGKPIYAKDIVSNVLIGTSNSLTNKTCLNFAAGPSFLNSKTYFTIKPAINFYFPDNKRLLAKISFTHIFQHDNISHEGFGFLNFCIGIKLF